MLHNVQSKCPSFYVYDVNEISFILHFLCVLGTNDALHHFQLSKWQSEWKRLNMHFLFFVQSSKHFLLPERKENPKHKSLSIHLILFYLDGITIDNETVKAMLSKCCRENNVSFFVFQRRNSYFYYIDRHIVASFCVINNDFFLDSYIFRIFLSVLPSLCNTQTDSNKVFKGFSVMLYESKIYFSALITSPPILGFPFHRSLFIFFVHCDLNFISIIFTYKQIVCTATRKMFLQNFLFLCSAWMCFVFFVFRILYGWWLLAEQQQNMYLNQQTPSHCSWVQSTKAEVNNRFDPIQSNPDPIHIRH